MTREGMKVTAAEQRGGWGVGPWKEGEKEVVVKFVESLHDGELPFISEKNDPMWTDAEEVLREAGETEGHTQCRRATAVGGYYNQTLCPTEPKKRTGPAFL